MKDIKIAIGLSRRARECGIFNDVVLFYQLKCINSHGFFHKKDVVSQLHSHLKLSKSNIYLKLSRLIELKLLHRNKLGYNLASYDQLFHLLKYDMTYNDTSKRLGDFKISKIKVRSLQDVKSLLDFVQIRHNLKAQTHTAFRSLKKDNRFQYTAKYKIRKNLGTRAQILAVESKDLVRLDEMNQFSINLNQVNSSKNLCNPDITLSLRGICSVLGLSNTSSAFLIINKLKQLKLVKILQRSFIVQCSVSYSDFKERFDQRFYRFESGVVTKKLSNKVIIL